MTMTQTGSRAMSAPAELLCAFANTLDVDIDSGSDALSDPAGLTTWLCDNGLVDTDTQASADDLRLATGLRAGIRKAMLAHHDGDTDLALPGLDEITAELPLRMTFEGTRPRLVPSLPAAEASAGLAWLLVAASRAQADGIWNRLKLCVAEDCAWAFVDTSKNRSRHWCSMGVCGNRQKTRAYRARQREKA